jgi:uroporphyrinogen-III synthase
MLLADPSKKRVLFPRAAEGRETLIDLLTAAGVEVSSPIAYRIAAAAPASAEARAAIARADAITFLSGETLRCFLEVVPEEEGRRLLERAVVAVIGPVAESKARELGVRVDVVPKTATLEALVEALAERLR